MESVKELGYSGGLRVRPVLASSSGQCLRAVMPERHEPRSSPPSGGLHRARHHLAQSSRGRPAHSPVRGASAHESVSWVATAYVAMRIAVGDVSLLGCRMFTWSLGCACSCEPELPSHQPHVVMEEGRVHIRVELGPRSTRPPSRQREFEAPTARRLGLGAGAETSRAAGREDGLATWRLEAAAILNSSHAPGNLICVRASPCGGRK